MADLPWLTDAKIYELTEGAIRPLPGAPDHEEAFYAYKAVLLVFENADIKKMEQAEFLAEGHPFMDRNDCLYVPFGDHHCAMIIRAGMGVGHSWEQLRNEILSWAASLDFEIEIRWPVARGGATRES